MSVSSFYQTLNVTAPVFMCLVLYHTLKDMGLLERTSYWLPL